MKTRILRIIAAGWVLSHLTVAVAQNDQSDQAEADAPASDEPNTEAAAQPEPEINRAPAQSAEEMIPARLVQQLLEAQQAMEATAPTGGVDRGSAPQAVQGQGQNRFNVQRNFSRSPQASSQTAQREPRTVLEPPVPGAYGTNELRMNFRNAPIELVLNYMSDAAGFIIELDTRVNGRVDIWSNTPITRNEAVDLLNSALNKNGFAAIRNGRTLRIMSRDEALRADKPVRVGNDPELIPRNDEIVTQIIPIRFVEAEQLVRDISPMLSPRATVVANQAGNSIIITDTQSNIRHVVEIIRAIDSSAEDVTEVRVFALQHHDPIEVAAMLTSLFSEQGNTAQTPVRFGGGPGGGFARFFGGQGGFNQGRGGGNNNRGNNNGSQDRIRRRARVVAVPDQRTGSVVVTAAVDLMDQIEGMIDQIDRESPKVSRVSVVRLENADPQRVQQVLQDMFQGNNNRNTRANQNSALMSRSQASQNQMGSGFGNFGAAGGQRQGGGGGINR